MHTTRDLTPASLDMERLKATRSHIHPRCVVCSAANPMGLAIEFVLQPDGGVEGSFGGSDILEGYPGLLHGGIIAALLDGAMTNCLFAQEVQALTAELTVRYRHPVTSHRRMIVRAVRVESHGVLHLIRAELMQDGCVKATARGKFIESHE